MRTTKFLVPIALAIVLVSGFALADTLKIYSMYNPGEPGGNILKQVAEDFEAATGHTVDITFAGREVMTKARPLILQGNPPDLVYQSLSELNGALLAPGRPGAVAVDDLLTGPGPDGEAQFLDVFPANILDMWKQDGHYYMVPEQMITSGFFYNKTKFAEAGVTPPTTWEELMVVAETLKSAGIDPFMQDDIGEYMNFWTYWAVVRVLGPGALLAAAQDETGATWDEPGYLQAAQMIEEVSKSGKDYFQKGYTGSTWPAAQSSWAQGNGAMLLVGSWIVNEVGKSAAPTWDPGFFPFPLVAEGGPNSVEARMNGWAIPAGAKNADLAKEFLRFDLQKKYQAMQVSDAHITAARKDQPYPAGLEDMKPVVDNASVFNKVFDGTQATLPDWYSTVFEPTNMKLVEGRLSAEDFIKQLKQDTINYWKNQ